MNTMRAVTIHAAGELHIDQRPLVDPGPGEVEVRVAVGGICGSDLHYFREGGVGDFRLREPMVLGHEVAGKVSRVGPGVSGIPEGARVAVHPARPCGECAGCLAGRSNLCTNMRFLGSAARFPHTQGGFSEFLIVSTAQIVLVPDELPLDRAVFAEPLAVGLHATHRAGDLVGREVLIAGAGPIGILALLAVRHAGAARIVVTDLVDEPLAVAASVGATETINVRSGEVPQDAFDTALEMSGSPAGLGSCVRAVRRGGRVVLVGLLPPGEVPAPMNLVVTREVDVVGSFRFVDEYQEAVAAMADGLDVTPLMSGRFPMEQAREAFELASDRTRATKVQLDLEASS